MQRLGVTIPFGSAELRDLPRALDALDGAGITDVWSSEVSGTDGFTPLAVAATSHPSYRLGTAIVSAYTRSPALLAMSAAALAGAASTEFVLGIGASSNVIVQQWNGIPFQKPYQRVRDVVRFLNEAFTQRRVDFQGDTFAVEGFTLTAPFTQRPRIAIAALRPGMLELAGRESDGAVINWLAARDVPRVASYVHKGNPSADIIARIFVVPTDDRTDLAAARDTARRQITTYLNVPVYADFHRWLGRERMLTPMWEAWARGDRREALKQVPSELLDELLLIGSPARIAAGVKDYVEAGVTTPVLQILADDSSALSACRAIGEAVGLHTGPS